MYLHNNNNKNFRSKKATRFHTFSRVWWIGDDHIVLPGNPENIAVSNGVDVGELSQLLEIWAHQQLHLTHVRLLDLNVQTHTRRGHNQIL